MRYGLWKEYLKNIICFAVIFFIMGSYIILGHDKFNAYITGIFSGSRAQGEMAGKSGLAKEMTYLAAGVKTVKPPAAIRLEIEEMFQLPELPTGCEAVSLTMLLKYYGFDDLEKTTIVDNYLVRSEENFVEGFPGDPYQEVGGGCYAPAIEKTANDFFQDRGAAFQACDISGSSMEELYNCVAEGKPVLVWSTIDLADVSPTGIFCEYNGAQYEWHYGEHCVVLSGYDKEANLVCVNDPLKGRVQLDAARFWEIYEGMGRMAVIIEKI